VSSEGDGHRWIEIGLEQPHGGTTASVKGGLDDRSCVTETSRVSLVELVKGIVEIALIVHFARRTFMTLPDLRWARRKDALRTRVIGDELKKQWKWN
jgi:hypothetical protein